MINRRLFLKNNLGRFYEHRDTKTQSFFIICGAINLCASVSLCSILYPLDLWSHLCASRLEEKHKKTGKTRKNNDGFIMFLGFYFVFYQAACGFCIILARRKNPRRPERWAAGMVRVGDYKSPPTERLSHELLHAGHAVVVDHLLVVDACG